MGIASLLLVYAVLGLYSTSRCFPPSPTLVLLQLEKGVGVSPTKPLRSSNLYTKTRLQRTEMTAPSPSDSFDANPDAPSTTPLYSPIPTRTIHHAVVDLGYSVKYVPIVARALDEFQLALSAANDGHFLLDQLVPQADRFEVLDVDHVSGNNRLEDLLFFSGEYAWTLLADTIGIATPHLEGPATGHPNPNASNRSRPQSRSRPPSTNTDHPADPTVDDDDRISVDGAVDPRISALEDRLIPGIDDAVLRAEVLEIAELAFVLYRTEPGFIGKLEPVVGCTFAARPAPHDDLVMAEPGPHVVPLPNGTRVD